MGWQDLLQQKDETIVLPWTGGKQLRLAARIWALVGPLPDEYGWYTFAINGRKAKLVGPAEPDNVVKESVLTYTSTGYLTGNRFLSDSVWVKPDPKLIILNSQSTFLVEPGLDLFTRVKIGRLFEGGPAIYLEPCMPLGPEDDVRNAYLDQALTVDNIPNVTPALDAAFRMETWWRTEQERRRLELIRLRELEEAKRQQELRRKELVEKLGDGAGRRAMAQVDFGEAARAALATGGATYLDHRAAPRRNEFIVRFRFDRQRFECVCDNNLRIIDSGICLTDHDGTKGDTWFSLESLPSVIKEAIEDDKLVVYRHVY